MSVWMWIGKKRSNYYGSIWITLRTHVQTLDEICAKIDIIMHILLSPWIWKTQWEEWVSILCFVQLIGHFSTSTTACHDAHFNHIICANYQAIIVNTIIDLTIFLFIYFLRFSSSAAAFLWREKKVPIFNANKEPHSQESSVCDIKHLWPYGSCSLSCSPNFHLCLLNDSHSAMLGIGFKICKESEICV